jgi:uncharacterized membrane-anchored protein YitT (DUF2179 family)
MKYVILFLEQKKSGHSMDNNNSELNKSEIENENTLESKQHFLDEELDDSYIFSKAIFRKLAKKYNKSLDRVPSDEELIDLIRQDLVTKRQNSLLIKAYFKAQFWKELMMLFLATVFSTIAYDYFITTTGKTGIFPAGTGAIARLLATITFSDPSQISSFFFVYQFAINIPLMIFGIFKLGWKFTIVTVLYIGLQILVDQIFQYIPVINPNDFHFIVDYQFLQTLDNSWNFAIWLLIFGIVGGAFLGLSFSFIYRIGGSSGGIDFITIYLSKKSNKPVGGINRNASLIILFVVIISNTIITPTDQLNRDILVRITSGINLDETFKNGQTLGQMLIDALAKTNWTGDLTADNLSSALQYLIQNNVSGFNDIISQLPTKYEALIKVEFIIGPSMFGSITLIVISGICTNFLYPKYKLRTYMISTNMPKEINKKIIDLGFQNEIASWDTTNRSRGNYLHRTMFMLSMPVMQWSSIQGELFMIDPYIKITILRTKAVVGLFKYEPVQNSERQEVMEQVTNDENEIEKIKQVAIVKFKHQMDSVSEKRTRLYEDIKAGGERQKRAEREIKKITKKRNEMITKFKQNIHDIKNMSNDGTNEIPNLPNDKKTKK